MTLQSNESGQVITLFSTAASAGKTVAAINIATVLYHKFYKVCLVDLDLQFNDVCRYLKIEPEATLYDFSEGLGEGKAIDDYLIKRMDGMDILAAPKQIDEAYDISAGVVTEVLKRLRNQYDYVVVDTTTGFTDSTLAAIDLSDQLVFMGIIDFIPTIKNMKIGLDTLLGFDYDQKKIKLVLNRERAKTHISVRDVEKLLGRSFFHAIPNDFESVISSIQTGQSLVSKYQQKDIAANFVELADKLLDPQSGEHESGFSGWLGKLLKS